MIVRLNGGLGNQMFQYAFGISVAAKRGEELFFEQYGLGKGWHRAYSLSAFNVDIKFGLGCAGRMYNEAVFRFDPGVYTAPPNSFFTGCWQTEKYFDEPVVRKAFQLRLPPSAASSRVADAILGAEASAFIHVRRTDYLQPHAAVYHGNMPLEYYRAASNYIQERAPGVKFFVFSDEPEWCRIYFPGCHIVGHNGMGSGDTGPATEHEDLWLMSLCQHAILPNSSFGWWGAWLGDVEQPRTVIGPKQWFVKKDLESCDIIPERWIKL